MARDVRRVCRASSALPWAAPSSGIRLSTGGPGRRRGRWPLPRSRGATANSWTSSRPRRSTAARLRVRSKRADRNGQERGGFARAAGNDRPWPDGSEYGAPALEGRPPMRGIRHVRRRRWRSWRRRRPSALPRWRSSREADEAAGGLADGAGWRGRQDHRRSPAASRARRHPHRRRQFLLHRRHPPREGTDAARASTMSMSAPAAASGGWSAAIA